MGRLVKIRAPKEFDGLYTILSEVARFFDSKEALFKDMLLHGYQPDSDDSQEILKSVSDAKDSIALAKDTYEKLMQFLESLKDHGIEVEF